MLHERWVIPFGTTAEEQHHIFHWPWPQTQRFWSSSLLILKVGELNQTRTLNQASLSAPTPTFQRRDWATTDEIDVKDMDGKCENVPVGVNVSAVTSSEPSRLPCRQQTAGWWQTWPAGKNKNKLHACSVLAPQLSSPFLTTGTAQRLKPGTFFFYLQRSIWTCSCKITSTRAWWLGKKCSRAWINYLALPERRKQPARLN